MLDKITGVADKAAERAAEAYFWGQMANAAVWVSFAVVVLSVLWVGYAVAKKRGIV